MRFKTRSSMVLFFLRGSLHFFFCGIIGSLLVAFLDMINPKIIQYTVDYCIDDKQSKLPSYMNYIMQQLGGREVIRHNLGYIALTIICIAFVAAIFRYLSKVFNTKGAEKLVETMRNTLFEHILKLPYSWHSENHTGDIIQRCTSDVETIKNFLSGQLVSFFRVVIMISLALYFMFSIDAKLSLIAMTLFPVLILYSFFFHRRIGDAFRRADEQEGKLSAIAQENLTGVRIVRAFGREQYEKDKFTSYNDDYTKMWTHLMKLLSAFWASNDLISGLQVMIVTVMGAVFSVQGHITAGEFIAFVSYNAMLIWPVRMLGRIISEMSKAGISIDRVRYIMNSQEEADAEDAIECPIDRDIVFDNVSYAFDTAEAQEILKNVSFTIKSGTTLGILGGTGSGKSTLMYLLDRLYDLPKENGTITIGGVDIRNIKRSWLRKNLGFVLQEPYLFSRTLSENIGIAAGDKGSVSMDKIRHASKIAALDESVEKFPSGYDTFVGERGVTLSGGQKQRTAIAQMLIEEPPVMIFDDSLSAVDTQTDARIRKALSENIDDATVILISHRIMTLMHADNIIVLDKGRIVEQGTHEELIAKKGIYYTCAKLQGLDVHPPKEA
jgi:ATP-binding cassette subfamily B protein